MSKLLTGAVWRGPCANNSGLRPGRTRGVVLHVNDGPNVSLWDWVNKASSNMSCHFQVFQNGVAEQYLDTDWWAWCQADGNAEWISIEMPTYPAVGMTAAQLRSAAAILIQCRIWYGFPLQLTDDPVNGTGFGWHGMGGTAWGGHTACPGDIRKAQRADILTLASGSVTTIPGDDSMSAADVSELKTFMQGLIGTMPYQISTQLAPAASDTRVQVQAINRTLNDPVSGTHVRVAQTQAAVAALPAAIAAELAKIAPDIKLDPTTIEAIATSVVTKIGVKLA